MSFNRASQFPQIALTGFTIAFCYSTLQFFPTMVWQTPCLAQNASDAKDNDEHCSQPGRIESARRLLAQSEKFKLKASQFHAGANKTIDAAKRLKGQADKLHALTGAIDKNAPQEYKANLAAFKEHSDLYRAHLAQVESTLGHCQDSEREYQAHLQEYTLHADMFHLPNIQPPHICGRLQLSEQQASHIANSLRADQQRVMLSEQQLASAEAKLQNAMAANAHADSALQKRSRLTEEERKLAGEFSSLKTEYELLKMQHDALAGHTTNVSTSVKSVRGKIK